MPERPSMPKSWVSASLTDVCEILDHKRVPVNNRERNRRIAGRLDADLYPYFGATGQAGVIDDFIFEGEPIFSWVKMVRHFSNRSKIRRI